MKNALTMVLYRGSKKISAALISHLQRFAHQSGLAPGLKVIIGHSKGSSGSHANVVGFYGKKELEMGFRRRKSVSV